MTDIIRPESGGALKGLFLRAFPAIAALGRRLWPIPKLPGGRATLRWEDVREVFERDDVFEVVYKERLDRIMGGEPFFLGMRRTKAYEEDTAAMRKAMPPADIRERLVPATNAAAAAEVAAGGDRIEVVDMVRRITFDVLSPYFGTPTPAAAGEDMALWATRLFEYQFVSDDAPLVAEVDRIAPLLRAHIDALITARKAGGALGNDVLGRALELQVQGMPGTSDIAIRSALIGFIVGGFPQPPMVVPHALNQLLKRPDALAAARRAALTDDDVTLGRLFFEAMRFEPLAPGVQRRATRDFVLARGTPRETRVRKGERVLASFHSAMHDAHRMRDPARFEPDRGPEVDMNFGHGLHRCFGAAINQTLLPLMVKPLLRQEHLRRAPGTEGRLTKRGPFAHKMVVFY